MRGLLNKTIYCILFYRAAKKILEVATDSNGLFLSSLVLPSRAANILGIYEQKQQLTVFCSGRAATIWELANKSDSNWRYFVMPPQRSNGIYKPKKLQLTVFCSGAQRKLQNLPTKVTPILYFVLPGD